MVYAGLTLWSSTRGSGLAILHPCSPRPYESHRRCVASWRYSPPLLSSSRRAPGVSGVPRGRGCRGRRGCRACRCGRVGGRTCPRDRRIRRDLPACGRRRVPARRPWRRARGARGATRRERRERRPTDVSAALDRLSPGARDEWLNTSPNGQWLLTAPSGSGAAAGPAWHESRSLRAGGAIRASGSPLHADAFGAISSNGRTVVYPQGGGPHVRDLWVTRLIAGRWTAPA